MRYKDIFKESEKKAHNSLIATKIFDRMEELRTESDKNEQRRWIWELLQNAKDVAYDDQQVTTEINIQNQNETKSVSFSHNGKPFSVDNIMFLIKQVSTKERNATEDNGKPKTTGKFGTGFLTTHLLSEKVKISGVIKEPDLDYRSFVLPLDRSGETLEQIIESVNQSILVLDNLDTQPALSNYNANDFNTTFIYNLDDDGYDVAKIGIEDLHLSLPYTLAFLPSIKSVSIKHENVVYELSKIENLAENIKVSTIHKKSSSETIELKIITVEKNNTTIAVEIERRDDKTFLKDFAIDLPKIFCDFPLIGTNDFYLPFVINSSNFNPTKERYGVTLTDKEDNKVIENKKIFLDGVELYFELLDYAVKNNWDNLFLLANTKTPVEKKWFSKPWFEGNIQKPIRAKLLHLPLVSLENGERVSIKNEENKANIYFPYHSNEEVRERIWNLEYKLFPDSIPAKKDVHNWYHVAWDDCFKDDLRAVTKFIQGKENINEFSKRLDNDMDKSIEWLNEYYDLLNFEEKFINEIIADYYAVIPNQKGVFKKRTALKVDKNIDEELKNVLEILGVDIRSDLVNLKASTGSKTLYSVKTQENVVDDINQKLKAGSNQNGSKAISYLLSLYSEDDNFPIHRKLLYDFCKDLIPDEIPERKLINKWSNEIWEICDNLRVGRLVKIVSKCENLSTLKERLGKESDEATIIWLNSFISFLNQQGLSEKLNLKTSPILPNQNGIFCVKDELSLDNGEIDEALKDILETLDYPIKNELLDKNIFLELPQNRERDAEFVATEITKLIKPKFSEVPQTEETKRIFKSLYLWFNKNKELAKDIFEDLYKNKHKLYDDDEIAANFEKAEILDEICAETGLLPDEIKEKLKAPSLPSGWSELISEEADENIYKKALIYILGKLSEIGINDVQTFDAFIEKAKNDEFLIRIDRPTTTTQQSIDFDKAEYAIKIMLEAISKIKPHLQSKGYEFIDYEKNYPNIFSVKLNQKEFKVVMRPSHGKRFHIHSFEQNVLENKENELWVSDGDSVQEETLTSLLNRFETKVVPTGSFIPGMSTR